MLRARQATRPGPALICNTAGKLIEKKARPLAVALAWQCHSVGDQAMAEDVFDQAVGGAAFCGDDERLCISLAAVKYLWQTG